MLSTLAHTTKLDELICLVCNRLNVAMMNTFRRTRGIVFFSDF